MHNVNSPRSDDGAIEQEIQAKGLTAPRVTPADIESNIAAELYFTGAEGELGAAVARVANETPDRIIQTRAPDLNDSPLRLLTFCVLALKNGFTVTGESACASPENFDAEIGKKIARANAVNKIWPLMGYELRSRLAGRAFIERKTYSDGTAATGLGPLPDLSPAQQDIVDATPADFVCYLGTKQIYARPMTRGEYNAYRGWTMPANEDPSEAGYLVEYTDGGKPNDSRHDGYISWSPRDVFERAYRAV